MGEQTERPGMQCPTHGPHSGVWIGGAIRGVCPVCQQERELDRQRIIELERADKVNGWIAQSGIAPLFRSASLDNFVATTPEQRAALTACRAFVDDMQPGQWGAPWLIGTPGTGKTHLACAMASAFMWKHGMAARYTTPRAMVRAIRDTWGRRDSPERETDVIDRFAYAPLLIIDEVGSTVGSEAEAAQVFEIVDLRYGSCLPTVLASNLTAKEIRAAIGDRAYDRLQQGAQVIKCTWPSYRGSA